jgi:hypothetical protein
MEEKRIKINKFDHLDYINKSLHKNKNYNKPKIDKVA